MKRLGLIASIVLSVAAFGFLYRRVIAKLVYDWMNDGNYSHGFLIVPIAAYLVWERRTRLTAEPIKPSAFGLVILGGSLATLGAGILGAELFLSRVSMIGVVAGVVLFTMGWRALRRLAFPIAFLLLMIPIPAIIFNQIAFPLQLLASKAAEFTLSGLGIPVLREGNVIVLANTSLEVAEACSGIRSLISLVTLAIVYGYFTDKRVWARLVLALAAVPVAVFANGVRVAGTGVAAHYYGAAAA
jgi:exosortase